MKREVLMKRVVALGLAAVSLMAWPSAASACHAGDQSCATGVNLFDYAAGYPSTYDAAT